MKRARIILADDHALMLDGIRNILKPKYSIVAAVVDGRALVDSALRLKPDLIILDITMPVLNGIDAAREIRKRLPDVKLLFVTMHNRPTYLQTALAAGANGYLVKSSGRDEILAAVASVLAGNLYVSEGLDREGIGRAAPPHLSARERQVLQLIAEGKSRKEKAYELGISEKTVAFHRTNLKRKLGLSSTAELTRYAIEEGLV